MRQKFEDLPFNPFKDASQKAGEDFRRAYEKGVNLGPQRWGEAVTQFSSASKHYAEAGDTQKSQEAYALATLFYALLNRDATAWQTCSQAMANLGNTTLNVGFSADSAELSRQAQIVCEDRTAMAGLNGATSDTSRVESLKALAQRYMELNGSDLTIWKLQKQELDPQRQAYYLLGLASLVEANNVTQSDPARGVSLLSESATYMEMAGIDPLTLGAEVLTKRDNVSRVGKCWFCGREVQGLNTQYVMIPSYVSPYISGKYGSELPSSVADQSIVGCMSCYSAIRHVADIIARDYYEKAMEELRAVAQTLQAEITSLESRIETLENSVSSLRSRVSGLR